MPADRVRLALEAAEQFLGFFHLAEPDESFYLVRHEHSDDRVHRAHVPQEVAEGAERLDWAALWPSDNSRNPSAQDGQTIPECHCVCAHSANAVWTSALTAASSPAYAAANALALSARALAVRSSRRRAVWRASPASSSARATSPLHRCAHTPYRYIRGTSLSRPSSNASVRWLSRLSAAFLAGPVHNRTRAAIKRGRSNECGPRRVLESKGAGQVCAGQPLPREEPDHRLDGQSFGFDSWVAQRR